MVAIGILLVAALAGTIAILRARTPPALNKWEIIALINDFLEGRRSEWEWDEAWVRPGDSYGMDDFKSMVAYVPKQHPPDRPGSLCNAAGMARLRELRDELLKSAV